jgi:hypothetical protein
MLRTQTTGRQQCGCIIPQAVNTVSGPEDGRNRRPKHVELIGINKSVIVASSWWSILFISMIHGQMNVKFCLLPLVFDISFKVSIAKHPVLEPDDRPELCSTHQQSDAKYKVVQI